MIKQRLKILIKLANSDGELHEKERELIFRLGTNRGLSKDDIEELFLEPGTLADLDLIPDEEKFDHLFDLIQLMKVDGEVYDEEVVYCQSIAKRLGFELSHVMEMYPYIHANLIDHEKKKELKRNALDYLKEKRKKAE